MVSRSLQILALISGISVSSAQRQAVFSYCGGDQCTISLSESVVTWNAAATTFTNADEYSAFESSLSASATDDPEVAVITLNAALPTKVIQTADNGFATITCCDERVVQGYFLFEPSSCGPRHTGISLGFTPSGYDGYNSAFVTIVPIGTSVNDSEVLGTNQCTTENALPGAGRPLTKTYFAQLVVDKSTTADVAPSLDVPSLINGPVFTGAPVTTGGGSETAGSEGSEGSGSSGAASTTSGGGNPPAPTTAGTTGTVAMPSAEASSAVRENAGAWAACLYAAGLLAFVQLIAML